MDKVKLIMFFKDEGVISVYEPDFSFEHPVGEIRIEGEYIGFQTCDGVLNGASTLTSVADEIEWLLNNVDILDKIGIEDLYDF